MLTQGALGPRRRDKPVRPIKEESGCSKSKSAYELSGRVIAAALEVHRTLGPGLLESVYERALLIELDQRSISARAQVEIPVLYRATPLGLGFRADIVVDDKLLVEVKSVVRLDTIHLRQVLTYLRLSGIRTALLINFNAVLLRNGIKRVSL